MADLMSKREVSAPVKDWLTREEVKTALANCGSEQISDTTLDRLIADGLFPQGVRWPKGVMWRWEDVAYYMLGRIIGARLKQADPADVDDDDPAEAPASPRKAPKSTT